MVECKAHMAKDCSRKASNNSATQLDGELRGTRQILLCFLGHGAEGDFVAKLVHGKLPNGVGNLSAKNT